MTGKRPSLLNPDVTKDKPVEVPTLDRETKSQVSAAMRETATATGFVNTATDPHAAYRGNGRVYSVTNVPSNVCQQIKDFLADNNMVAKDLFFDALKAYADNNPDKKGVEYFKKMPRWRELSKREIK